MSQVENLCIRAGCGANGKYPSCCHDITIFTLSGDEIKDCFPDATYIPWLNSINPGSEDGVYYSERNPLNDGTDPYTAKIIGPCPNLGPTGNCTKANKPQACIDAPLGGMICTNCRFNDGLKPVDVSILELQQTHK